MQRILEIGKVQSDYHRCCETKCEDVFRDCPPLVKPGIQNEVDNGERKERIVPDLIDVLVVVDRNVCLIPEQSAPHEI